MSRDACPGDPPKILFRGNIATAAFAIFVVAAMTALLFALLAAVGTLLQPPNQENGASVIGIGLITFMASILFWLLALGLIGGPVWILLHILGKRNWSHALLCGSALPVIFILILDSGILTGASWHDVTAPTEDLSAAPGAFLLFSILGGAQGYLCWRIAYRVKVEPPAN